MKTFKHIVLLLLFMFTPFCSLSAEDIITTPLKTIGFGDPHSFDFSADETKLAIVSGVEGIRIWDCETGEMIRTLTDSANGARGVAFSPDYKQLITGNMDSCGRLYSVETGELLRVFPKDYAHITRALWSPTGTHFAFVTGPGRVTVWSVETGEMVSSFLCDGWVRGVQFTPDGSKIFVCGNKKTGYLCDILTGEKVETFFSDNSFKGAAISPDGTHIISIHAYKDIAQLWDISDGQNPLFTFNLSGGLGRTVGFNRDGSEVIVCDTGGVTQFWSCETGDSLRVSEDSSMVMHFGKEKMVSYDNSGLSVRGLISGEHQASIAGYTGRIYNLITQENGSDIIIGKGTLGTGVIDSESGLISQNYSINKVTNHAQLSQSGRLLAYTTCDSVFGVWDVVADTSLFTKNFTVWTNRVSFSPDEKKVSVGTEAGTIYVYDSRSGDKITHMKYSVLSISGLAWTLDGKKLISADRSGYVFYWDVETGDTLYKSATTHCSIDDMAISKDRSKVAVCGDSRVVFLFDVVTGELLQTFEGHTNYVESIAITPDGKYIVTGSMDDEIKLWNSVTGECLRTYLKHRSHVDALAFASDGKTFFSGDFNGCVYQWDMGEYIGVIDHTEKSTSMHHALQLQALNKSTLLFHSLAPKAVGKVSLFLPNGRKVQSFEYDGSAAPIQLQHSLASGSYLWRFEQREKLMGRGRLMVK